MIKVMFVPLSDLTVDSTSFFEISIIRSSSRIGVSNICTLLLSLTVSINTLVDSL